MYNIELFKKLWKYIICSGCDEYHPKSPVVLLFNLLVNIYNKIYKIFLLVDVITNWTKFSYKNGCSVTLLNKINIITYFENLTLNYMFFTLLRVNFVLIEYYLLYDLVGTLPQLIGFIRFGEPVPHGLSARHRVWAGPTKG